MKTSGIYGIMFKAMLAYSYQAPESFIDTNVRGTLNVLQAALQHGEVKVVQTSSSEVYGTPAEVPITEDHPLRAQSPYAASKIAADKLVESFFYSFGLPVVTLRPTAGCSGTAPLRAPPPGAR